MWNGELKMGFTWWSVNKFMGPVYFSNLTAFVQKNNWIRMHSSLLNSHYFDSIIWIVSHRFNGQVHNININTLTIHTQFTCARYRSSDHLSSLNLFYFINIEFRSSASAAATFFSSTHFLSSFIFILNIFIQWVVEYEYVLVSSFESCSL